MESSIPLRLDQERGAALSEFEDEYAEAMANEELISALLPAKPKPFKLPDAQDEYDHLERIGIILQDVDVDAAAALERLASRLAETEERSKAEIERVRGLVRSRDKTLQAIRRHMDNIGDGEGLRRFFGRAPRD